MVGWLVGNAVFSETALRIFLIFCIKLGTHKARKVREPDFLKKWLIWRYLRKIFLVFGLKLALNMTFSLNETCFFRKKMQFWDVWPWNHQKITQTEIFSHFLDFVLLAFLNFVHNDRWAQCLVVFYNSLVQSMCSCFSNVF